MLTENDARSTFQRQSSREQRWTQRRIRTADRKLRRYLRDPRGTRYPWKTQPHSPVFTAVLPNDFEVEAYREITGGYMMPPMITWSFTITRPDGTSQMSSGRRGFRHAYAQLLLA